MEERREGEREGRKEGRREGRKELINSFCVFLFQHLIQNNLQELRQDHHHYEHHLYSEPPQDTEEENYYQTPRSILSEVSAPTHSSFTPPTHHSFLHHVCRASVTYCCWVDRLRSGRHRGGAGRGPWLARDAGTCLGARHIPIGCLGCTRGGKRKLVSRSKTRESSTEETTFENLVDNIWNLVVFLISGLKGKE